MSMHDDPLYQKALDRLADKCYDDVALLDPYLENDVDDLARAALVMAIRGRDSDMFDSTQFWVSKMLDRAVIEYQEAHVEDMIHTLREEEREDAVDHKIDEIQQKGE